jgi:hypothetical protein
MRMKNILGLCMGCALLIGCGDDTSLVGPSIQPTGDQIAVYIDTFQMQASTVLLDSIYVRTTTGQLGEMEDPLYGTIKSDFLCQFYCPANFTFEHTPIDGKIDSVDFRIYYTDPKRTSTTASYNHNGIFVGDSLVPMRAEIFQLTSTLDRNFYSNVDPSKYCDMKHSLGRKTYVAYDRSVSDSLRATTSFVPKILIRMPQSFGQKFYEETINNPSSFASQDAFNKFFPGLYVTTTYGSGNIISVSSAELNIYYRYYTKGSSGQDSIVNTGEYFNVTKEVIQLNRFKNANLAPILAANDTYTYIKTPAGVCTKFVLPTKEIAAKESGHIFNDLPLTLKAMPQENWKYAMTPPQYLLLIPADSVKLFFESNSVEDSQTKFLTSSGYDASTRSYTFGNISNLIQNQIDKNPDKDLEVYVIPVERTTSTTSSYYSTSTYTSKLENYISPSGVKLLKSNDAMKLIITSSKYAK